MTPFIPGWVEHILESTLFALAIALLTLLLKENRASVRCWMWRVASLKFLAPYSLLVGLGGYLAWAAVPAHVMEQLSFEVPLRTASISAATPVPIAADSGFLTIAVVVWLCGCAGILLHFCLGWHRMRLLVRKAEPCRTRHVLEALQRVQSRAGLESRIDLLIPVSPIEPGVFGIVRPVVLFPAGLIGRLTDAQLEAILAHEACHVRRHDNLCSALHTLVEALFWFHPLVWVIGSKLVAERERASDEQVLTLVADPRAYAEGIVKVCEFSIKSPSPCAIGVTGGNLLQRVERIMSSRAARKLDAGRKLLLTAAGAAAVSIPILFGAMNAQRVLAQAATPSQSVSFEVASIRPAERWKAGGEGRTRETIQPSPEGLTLRNVTLSSCLQWAYGVKFYQVSGPDWLKSDRYDVEAKAAGPVSRAEMKRMLQALLAERFRLVLHREKKDFPLFALLVARNGPRLRSSNAEGNSDVQVADGSFVFIRVSMPDFAEKLADLRTIDRPVVDHTGIAGVFDITLKGAASAVLQDDGPSIFTLVQEQLGLRLEPRRGPLDLLVVDHAERNPTGN